MLAKITDAKKKKLAEIVLAGRIAGKKVRTKISPWPRKRDSACDNICAKMKVMCGRCPQRLRQRRDAYFSQQYGGR